MCISPHVCFIPPWISVLTSWTASSTDECGCAASSTTRRSSTSCPAPWWTRRGRPERRALCHRAGRAAPTSSPRSAARTSGINTLHPTDSRGPHPDLTGLCQLYFQHHDPGEQGVCPEAEDQTRDQDEGTGEQPAKSSRWELLFWRWKIIYWVHIAFCIHSQ